VAPATGSASRHDRATGGQSLVGARGRPTWPPGSGRGSNGSTSSPRNERTVRPRGAPSCAPVHVVSNRSLPPIRDLDPAVLRNRHRDRLGFETGLERWPDRSGRRYGCRQLVVGSGYRNVDATSFSAIWLVVTPKWRCVFADLLCAPHPLAIRNGRPRCNRSPTGRPGPRERPPRPGHDPFPTRRGSGARRGTRGSTHRHTSACGPEDDPASGGRPCGAPG
jgi:hypothetical protein